MTYFVSLPISTIESRVSYRLATHSRGLFTLEWTHLVD